MVKPDPSHSADDTAEAISLEFDDIVYSLQSFGGISEYWREMTTRIESMSEFSVQRRSGSTWGRMRRQRSPCRVFHSSYFRTARGPQSRTVTTVHDLVYELGHVGSGARARLHCLEHKRAYFSSDALICISNSTRRDLLQVYPALARRCHISVVPHGVNLKAAAIDVANRRQQLCQPPYLLFVGGRSAYKNFSGALHAFAASGLPRQGFLLACTGNEFDTAELEQMAQLGLKGSVYSLGKVTRTELAALYAGAYCLVYPSLFEGFGMPLLEAMQFGCPVVSSNYSAMPEVAGNAALLVDTRDPETIARALVEVGTPETRRRLISAGLERAKQFSWDRSAAEHAKVYRSLS